MNGLRISHRYALAACAGLLLASGMFFMGASSAFAAQTCLTDTQGKKICTATTPVSDTSTRTKPSPGANPNCKYYDGGNLTDCKNPDGSIESCIYTPLITGDLVTDCATRDTTGTITKINSDTIGAATPDINTGIDPTTGQVTTKVNSPTLNAVGGVIGTVFECVASGPVDCVITATGSAILKISQLFLGIAGVLFNYTIVYTVFEFSTVVGNAPGLLVAWGIMRDLGNMLLLFGFIFMGLATILDLHNYTAKKALPRLIIFAILMNFSLFAAEAVIDTANMFSSVLYEQAHSEQCTGLNSNGPVTAQNSTSYDAAVQDLTTDCRLNYGIGGSIMSASGLSTMFAVHDDQKLQSIAVYIGLSLFATIGAIVMIAASIMLIARTVILTFVMMLSPIGFAGMAVPALNGAARRWWSELLHQAFFAPILLLLILASLKVSESFAGVTGNNSLAQAFMQPNASVMGIILVFFMVIGLLVASLVAAKSFGARGATFAISTAKKTVLGSYGGISGYFGRKTIGATSATVQKKYEALMGNAPRGVQNFMMNTRLDEAVAGTLKAGQNARFGSSKSFKEDQEHHKARGAEFKEASRKANIQSELNSALAEPPSVDRDDKVAEILQRLSGKELEELDVLKKSGANLDVLARNLSPEKFAALVKDGSKLTEQEKKNLRESRFSDIREQQKILNSSTSSATEKAAAQAAIKDRIKKYSVKELENAPSDLLMDDKVAQHLTNSQRDDLIKNNNVSPAAVRKIRQFDPVEQINTAFATSGAAAAASMITSLKLNPKQVARLKPDLLDTNEVVQVLSAKMLQAIEDRNELDDTVTKRIFNKIMSVGTSATQKYVTTTPRGVAYWS